MAFVRAAIVLSTVLVNTIYSVDSYATGAPTDACSTLTPNHGVPPQNSRFPYTIRVDSGEVAGGATTKITISGGTFKGFLIQARDGTGNAVGEFQSGGNVQTIDCPGGQKNTATHTNSNDKTSVQATWTAPTNVNGDITFRVTVAQDGETFWVNQGSSPVTIK